MANHAAASLAERVEAIERRLAAAMLRLDGHVVGCTHLRREGPDVPCDHEPICEALRAFLAEHEHPVKDKKP